MRWALILTVGLVLTGPSWAQKEVPVLTPRYSQEFDTDGFPQNFPKETLASVLKAIDNRKVDYLLAHLADPLFVDARVQEVHGGSFGAMVQETVDKLRDDPESIALLRRFLKEGEVETQDAESRITIKGVKDKLFLKRYETRWFLDNKRK